MSSVADKLISRKVIAVMPPHVEYKLTKLGKEIIPALDSMETWGLKNNKCFHL